MMRKIKVLGVALVAVLALTAVVASTASAAKFTAASYPAFLTASSSWNNETFITEAGTVECAGHFNGTLSASSESQTMEASYSGCAAFGFLSAAVEMRFCDWVWTAPSGVSDLYSTSVDLTCPAGQAITIKVPATGSICTMTIGAQTGLKSLQITNNTGTADYNVQANITGISYTVTQDGFGCPFSGTGAKTGGVYKQDSSVTVDSTTNLVVG